MDSCARLRLPDSNRSPESVQDDWSSPVMKIDCTFIYRQFINVTFPLLDTITDELSMTAINYHIQEAEIRSSEGEVKL